MCIYIICVYIIYYIMFDSCTIVLFSFGEYHKQGEQYSEYDIDVFDFDRFLLRGFLSRFMLHDLCSPLILSNLYFYFLKSDW